MRKYPYKFETTSRTSIDINNSVEGESIEQQIVRMLNNGAPIEDEKIPIYTKPSEGIVYGTDIRGDKWDRAIEVNEKINNSIDKIRENKLKIVKDDEEKSGDNKENSQDKSGDGESIQG